MLPELKLLNMAGDWVLYYNGARYLSLPEAKSRQEAEEMVAELLQAARFARQPSRNQGRDDLPNQKPQTPTS